MLSHVPESVIYFSFQQLNNVLMQNQESQSSSVFILPLFYHSNLSFPLCSSVEMKDGYWGCGGQTLALLSNHYSSSFSSCTDRSSISRLLVLASPLVAHEYFTVHTYTHSTMHPSVQTPPREEGGDQCCQLHVSFVTLLPSL